MAIRLDPENLLAAYCRGAFPMTGEDGQICWYTADPRGIIPLDKFHVPHTLTQFMRSPRFCSELRIDSDFEGTMCACMASHDGPPWISPPMIRAYGRLHELGFAHSVETWRGGRMVGGLYGVSIGAAFFGESMFHHERDASKVALVHLVNRLRDRGYELLDAQAVTSHLRRFGCVEIPASEYMERLGRALQRTCEFV